jgi:hypothetical protein
VVSLAASSRTLDQRVMQLSQSSWLVMPSSPAAAISCWTSCTASGLTCHTQNHVSRLGACRVSAEALCLFDATCEGPALVVPVRLSPGDRKQATLSLELGPKLRYLLPKLSSLRTFFSHRDRQLER